MISFCPSQSLFANPFGDVSKCFVGTGCISGCQSRESGYCHSIENSYQGLLFRQYASHTVGKNRSLPLWTRPSYLKCVLCETGIDLHCPVLLFEEWDLWLGKSLSLRLNSEALSYSVQSLRCVTYQLLTLALFLSRCLSFETYAFILFFHLFMMVLPNFVQCNGSHIDLEFNSQGFETELW